MNMNTILSKSIDYQTTKTKNKEFYTMFLVTILIKAPLPYVAVVTVGIFLAANEVS